MANQEALFLSLEDVVKAGGTDMTATIADVEKGFALRESGKVIQPHKLILSSGENPADGFNLLPAIVDLDGQEVFGAKLLGAYPANIDRGLPRAMGLMAIYDGDTKIPLAVMDTQVISAMRTGAVSGLAARKLVPADTESVGLIGAGVNMRTQLLGVNNELPNLKRVMVHAINGSKYKFADEMPAKTGLEITPHIDPQEVIESNEFNILCTTKPSKPLIQKGWLQKSGVTLFNISGVATPLDAVAGMDRLVTDSWEDCLHRNTQSLPRAVTQGFVDQSAIEELGPILQNGNGRTNPEENIFFCPVGLAFEDVVVAWRIYQTALRKKIGQKVTLWADSQWI